MKFVSINVLKKLPVGKFIKVEMTENMDRETVQAIVWRHFSSPSGRARDSYFDAVTGTYIGEASWV